MWPYKFLNQTHSKSNLQYIARVGPGADWIDNAIFDIIIDNSYRSNIAFHDTLFDQELIRG